MSVTNLFQKPKPVSSSLESMVFWGQKHCLSHERHNTPRCCSCERLEPINVQYIALDDTRKLCLECFDSAIMVHDECQRLCLEIRDFYRSINMRISEKFQFPVVLAEQEVVQEVAAAMVGKDGLNPTAEIRGLCLSVGENNRNGIKYEVSAILVVRGLPRLLTGSILAHEFMHAWLRLNGFGDLSTYVEEGICEVVALMWLESAVMAESLKGVRPEFERKLGEFFIHRIGGNTLPEYGGGFRAASAAVGKYGLRPTLEHVRLTGRLPTIFNRSNVLTRKNAAGEIS